MANFPKPSRRNLPPPPPPSETTNNLSQPEHAPASVDGRTLRATGRLQQFATRVTPELKRDIDVWTAQNGLKLNEFLEHAFAALKREMGS